MNIKKPIVLILNDSDKKYSKLIKKFFKGKSGIKIYEKDFNPEKILLNDPKMIIDINENPNTKGIYINCTKSILEKVKKVLLINNNKIPFIGKKQINKNKKLEIQIHKRGIPYCYIEFPSNHFDFKTIIKTQLLILKKLINMFLGKTTIY